MPNIFKEASNRFKDIAENRKVVKVMKLLKTKNYRYRNK